MLCAVEFIRSSFCFSLQLHIVQQHEELKLALLLVVMKIVSWSGGGNKHISDNLHCYVCYHSEVPLLLNTHQFTWETLMLQLITAGT
jgi:hypothetical protein